jgi:hypothetical protein
VRAAERAGRKERGARLASDYVAADLHAQPVLSDAVNVGKSWRLDFLLKVLRDALKET